MLRVATAETLSTCPTFDLTEVLARVARHHPDWSKERLESAEAKYHDFMAKAKAQPGGEHFVSDKDLDVVWHTHILFTRKYEVDCKNFFGYFFHHHPGGVKDGTLEKKLTKSCCSGGCGD